MKTREECGAAYYNSMRRFDLGIFFCETDRKENNGMKLIDAEDCVCQSTQLWSPTSWRTTSGNGKVMFADDYVETNYSERENDEVKPVNAKLNDKIDVAAESVAEENNVMVDSQGEVSRG